ncbi:MAG: sterol desaturase family protein [Nitrospirota bacterium]|nr:sterol desaturase family protein [Nitrospirota bacterium]
MNIFLIDNEVIIRLGSFTFVFIVMALWEKVSPRRALHVLKIARWVNNLSITFLNGVAVKVVFPVTALGTALMARKEGYGVLNTMDIPSLPGGFIAIIALDLTIYFQHRLFHQVPLFWRLHRMHHTDMDIDVTTGARFHTIEILLSMLIKMAAVLLIGAPFWSVLAFEVLLNATSMFNHSNIFISHGIDRVVRLLVVTPDMHRVHHSVIMQETNSNYGFNLSWWDRLFNTYKSQPERGHSDMTVGLANYRDSKYLTLPWMLITPFLARER